MVSTSSDASVFCMRLLKKYEEKVEVMLFRPGVELLKNDDPLGRSSYEKQSLL